MAMIKDIVVNLSLATGRDRAADFAISVAEAFHAHLTGIAFALEPSIPMTGPLDAFPAGFIDEQRAENERAAKAAVERFNKAIGRTEVTAVARVLSAAAARGLFGRVARGFDLAALGQSAPDEFPTDPAIEAALFDSGRPVIVVPYIQKTGIKLDRVLVCWDGSRAAARAIADALPLLAKAKTIELLSVQSAPRERSDIPGIDMAEHLARYRLPLELKDIMSAEVDVGNIILSHAADSSADFIVMGGYGHSRMREFVLGGVTRTILESMTVPVLMSH
jgi:nucleotide-binding universal stress UspA family protein